MVLNNNDLACVSEAILRLYSKTTLENFPLVALEAISSIVPSEHSSFNQIDLQGGGVRIIMRPDMPRVQQLHPAFQEHFSEHPCWKHHTPHSDNLVRKTTDFVSQREFQELGIYREFYRHVDTRVQMIFYFDDNLANREIGIAINRLREFSERDRQLLSWLRPHLAQAHKNAVAFSNIQRRELSLQETLAGLSRGLVNLNSDGRITWLTPKAMQLLGGYFPGMMEHGDRLPEALERWSKMTLSRLHPSSPAPRPFSVVKDHSRLTVVFQRPSQGDILLLLTEEQDLAGIAAVQDLRLTKRETEVMRWITEGKSNPEIAVILGLSIRTVHKHVEHVMKKLGVETRNAVTRRVLELNGVL